MFRQIVKSAIDKGRLKFVETPKDDQSIPIGPDGKRFLHRLLQADPFKENVKAEGDGIKLSSKEVVEEHNEHNLRARIPSKLQWRRQGLGGSKQIQRSVQAQPKKTKAAISTSERNPRSLLHNY